MTFTKSYTTRRSQPMIRSRLRSPMSKSITATFFPRRASPQARLAEVVVLPTPPLPEVTTMISVNAESSSFDACEVQVLPGKPGLYGPAGQIGGNGLEDPEHTGDRDELGIELLAENPRAGVTVR